MNLLVATLVFSYFASILAFPRGNNRQDRPSTLNWAPCDLDLGLKPDTIQVPMDCAKLEVPLDYTEPESSEMLQLQLLKVNATKKPFKGSVLFNPGGPGGSGVSFVAVGAPVFDRILDGQYDLVGFDPRGTGKTIPFECKFWNDSTSATGLLSRDLLVQRDLTDLLVSEGWEDGKKISNACDEAQSKTGSFLSTAFVARDMAQIIDALNEDGKLRYWGTSYGTLLGSTFAAMFPDRVDRMLLDSVINPLDYMDGYWLQALLDSEKALLGFFKECIKSPSLCPLARLAGPMTTPQYLVQELNDVLQELLDNPKYLPVGAATYVSYKEPPVSFYEEIKRRIFVNLYAPSSFPSLAAELSLVLSRNFSRYENAKATNQSTSKWNEGKMAFWGIACSDAGFRAGSPEDMYSLVAAQQNASSFADVFMPLIWPCAQWRMQAAERYMGNFRAKTSFPLLFSSGRYDPITPLPSAFNASAGFEGSVVLTHNGHGHTFLSQPSLCMAKAVRAYFSNGTLPAPDTVCETDVSAFEVGSESPFNTTSAASGVENEDDRELLKALILASRTFS